MPRAPRSVLIVSAVALLAAACSNIGVLTPSRSDVTQAQADIVACRTSARSTADHATCSTKFGPTLAKITQDNFDQAGRAQDRATRINLYATAANAGWDSGTDSG